MITPPTLTNETLKTIAKYNPKLDNLCLAHCDDYFNAHSLSLLLEKCEHLTTFNLINLNTLTNNDYNHIFCITKHHLQQVEFECCNTLEIDTYLKIKAIVGAKCVQIDCELLGEEEDDEVVEEDEGEEEEEGSE